MPSVRHETTIDAPAGDVFDLVERVEDFARYSGLIRSVRKVSPGVFEWEIHLMGISLEWTARVVESTRPARFAWESVSGVCNNGAYDITPLGDHACRVSFRMDYHFANRLADAVISPAVGRLMDIVAEEVLCSIKKELEGR